MVSYVTCVHAPVNCQIIVCYTNCRYLHYVMQGLVMVLNDNTQLKARYIYFQTTSFNHFTHCLLKYVINWTIFYFRV